MGDRSNEYITPIDWKAYTEQYPWARNCYEDLGYRWGIYQNSVSDQKSPSAWNVSLEEANTELNYSDMFNECGALAKWMVDKGWRVDIAPTLEEPDGKFSEIQPGDIIFFAESLGMDGFKVYAELIFHGYNYRNISHAAIVSAVSVRTDMTGSSLPYAYQIDVICPPSLFENYLRQTSGHFVYSTRMEYTLNYENVYTNTNGLAHYLPSLSTIAMVCRPDLSSTKKTYLEMEAEKLGLHTVPENETQLNIIKRCRQCTDIEWTPGKDYDRVLPITGERNDYVGFIPNQGYKNTLMIEDAKFKAGVTYNGIPWTRNSSDFWNLNLNSFLSVIENENSRTAPVIGKSYPFYGWTNEIQLLQYVFGQDSCNVESSTDQYGYKFWSSLFSCDHGDPFMGSDGWLYLFGSSNPYYLDYSTLKLGDIVCSVDHYTGSSIKSFIGIITDIVRDSLDNVTHVELTEATNYGLYNPKDKNGPKGGLICRKMYTIDEFDKWYSYDLGGVSL